MTYRCCDCDCCRADTMWGICAACATDELCDEDCPVIDDPAELVAVYPVD